MKELNEYANILKNKSGKTIKVYDKYLGLFINYFKIQSPKNIEDITTKQLREFRDIIPGGESTKNLAMRVVSALINWMYLNEYVDTRKNIDRLETLKEPKKVKRFLTDEEKEAIISHAKYADVQAMMAMLIYQGLRRDEAINLKKIDYTGETLLINGKGKRQRKMQVHPLVKRLLDKYLATRKDNCEYLFVSHRRDDGVFHKISGESVRIQVRESAKRAGINLEGLSPHSLRHTFASSLLDEGRNLVEIAALMGHSSINTTVRYTHTKQTKLDTIVTDQKYESTWLDKQEEPKKRGRKAKQLIIT